MKIIGINTSHDASASMLLDGEIMAEVEEERFDRIKHTWGIPFQAINYCHHVLESKQSQIDVVACADDSDTHEHLLNNKGRANDLPQLSFSDEAKIIKVDHHTAHAASAYFPSGFLEPTLVVTSDGIGNNTSISIWRGQNGTLKLLRRYGKKASLGWFYEMVTEALGWWTWDGAGKTMGLAAYGNADRFEGDLSQFCPQFSNGELSNPQIVKRHSTRYRGNLHTGFTSCDVIKGYLQNNSREDLAAATQQLLENRMIELIDYWCQDQNLKSVACAGGIFLNVKLNQRIRESGLFSKQFIFPNAGDGGLAIGAALWAQYQHLGELKPRSLEHVYFGPSYTNDEINLAIETCGLKAISLDNASEEAAKLLSQNKIVGWFQGKMESGPRALGSRSILMSPLREENKDILNKRVKFRESFRPFCPSMTEESKNDYFEDAQYAPFMVSSYNVAEEKKSTIPAVVHVDGTLRPQTVRRSTNPKYWDLINTFGKLTGESIILNTSMNIRGEPIVNTPYEAIRCFFGSGMDYLIMGDFLIGKE